MFSFLFTLISLSLILGMVSVQVKLGKLMQFQLQLGVIYSKLILATETFRNAENAFIYLLILILTFGHIHSKIQFKEPGHHILRSL